MKLTAYFCKKSRCDQMFSIFSVRENRTVVLSWWFLMTDAVTADRNPVIALQSQTTTAMLRYRFMNMYVITAQESERNLSRGSRRAFTSAAANLWHVIAIISEVQWLQQNQYSRAHVFFPADELSPASEICCTFTWQKGFSFFAEAHWTVHLANFALDIKSRYKGEEVLI